MLNVIAMLVSFVALVALVKWRIRLGARLRRLFPESIPKRVLGWVFPAIAFAMVCAWHDRERSRPAGTRMVLTSSSPTRSSGR